MRKTFIRFASFTQSTFFDEAADSRDATMRKILPDMLIFTAFAALVTFLEYYSPPEFEFTIDITPYEIGGAVLGMLLVLRTNEGIGRWWEARKLWGGITNQSRNLAVAMLTFGPKDPAWRRAAIYWTIAFGHACRRSLRGEKEIPEIARLIGPNEAAKLANSDHMPTHVAMVLARILHNAVETLGMDRRYFLQLDKERMTFMDEIGGCERILKTPMPRAYSIAIRRFIIIFLVLLPFGLIPKIDRDRFNQAAGSIDRSRMWLTPLVAMIAAFPLLALDRIGEELQNPFSTKHLNHLDLDGITATIERNLLALIDGPLVDQDITKHIDVIEIVTRDDGAG